MLINQENENIYVEPDDDIDITIMIIFSDMNLTFYAMKDINKKGNLNKPENETQLLTNIKYNLLPDNLNRVCP